MIDESRITADCSMGDHPRCAGWIDEACTQECHCICHHEREQQQREHQRLYRLASKVSRPIDPFDRID